MWSKSTLRKDGRDLGLVSACKTAGEAGTR